jgi:hypothetical protein
MFNCSAQPGMAAVFMELISFESSAFRSRKAVDLGLVDHTMEECRLIWADAVVIGVVDTGSRLDPNSGQLYEGIACAPDRVIRENDRVIFVAKNANPKAAGPFSRGAELAEVPKIRTRKLCNILVCGWREAWNDSARLRARISDLAQGLEKGSRLEFLNAVEPDYFAEVMDGAGFQRYEDSALGRQGWDNGGIRITHWHGDACNLGTLQAVLQSCGENTFESTVILGTRMGEKAPNQSRDMRVMCTMLLMRRVFEELFPDSSLHIVGENCIDATSDLALTSLENHTPDFVNTQAIYARALTMALAYPLAQPAIAQLFYTHTDSPYLRFVYAGREVIPFGPATFAQVTMAVARTFEGAVCIGYMTKDGDREFAPHPSASHTYTDGDVVLIFVNAGVPHRQLSADAVKRRPSKTSVQGWMQKQSATLSAATTTLARGASEVAQSVVEVTADMTSAYVGSDKVASEAEFASLPKIDQGPSSAAGAG